MHDLQKKFTNLSDFLPHQKECLTSFKAKRKAKRAEEIKIKKYEPKAKKTAYKSTAAEKKRLLNSKSATVLGAVI